MLKKVTDLSEKKKRKRHISTRFGVGRVKIENIKENQTLKFDIKEDKEKLQAINLKKFN